MKAVAKEDRVTFTDPKEHLCWRVKELAKRDDRFVRELIEEKVTAIRELAATPKQESEIICDISDERLIEVLAETIYYEVLSKFYELKVEAASKRTKTSLDRFWQLVADLCDRPDHELMAIDLPAMQVIKGDNEIRIDLLKEKVLALIDADRSDLHEIVKKNGKGTFEGDIAIELLSENRERVIELIKAIFDSEDIDFLRSVWSKDAIPTPLRVLAKIMSEIAN